MSARNMLIMAPAQAAQVLVGLGTVVVFTRLISPAEYGVYGLVLSASMMAHTAAMTWAEAAAFRFLPQAERTGEEKPHFATLLLVALAASVISAAILTVCLIGMAWHGWTAAAIGFSATLSPVRFLTKVARETDRAEQRMARYAWRETLFLVGGFCAGVALLALTPMGPAAPFAGATLAGLFCLIFDLPNLMRRAGGGQARFQPNPSRPRSVESAQIEKFRPLSAEKPDSTFSEIGLGGFKFGAHAARLAEYARYGMPLAIGLAIELAMQTATRGALAAYEGEAAAGAFTAAVGAVGRALDVLFIWTALAFAPPLLRAFEGGEPGAIAAASANLARGLIAVAAPATVGLCLVAYPLCALLVGEGLAKDAAYLAPYVAVMGLANGLAVYLATEAFVLSRRTGLRTAILIPVAVFHLGLVIVMTQHFGLTGAGIASVLSAVAAFALLSAIGMRVTPLTLPWGDIGKVVIACLAMAGAVMAMPAWGGLQELLGKAAVGAVVYAASVTALDVGGLRTWLGARLTRAPA
jgi:O-antigen/teichoic acid export membrane protein